MASFTNLEAWKVAMNLLEEIYTLTSTFPTEEKYSLTSQMRRAAVSIVGNIAEGYGRFTYADRANKFVIARGECTELEAYILIAIRIKRTTPDHSEKAKQLVQRTGRLLSGLITSCNNQKSLRQSMR